MKTIFSPAANLCIALCVCKTRAVLQLIIEHEGKKNVTI
jgi:hypothetical protein